MFTGIQQNNYIIEVKRYSFANLDSAQEFCIKFAIYNLSCQIAIHWLPVRNWSFVLLELLLEHQPSLSHVVILFCLLVSSYQTIFIFNKSGCTLLVVNYWFSYFKNFFFTLSTCLVKIISSYTIIYQ